MSIPRNWRTRQQRYCLKGEICNRCNRVIFPPRDVCPNAVREIDQFLHADPINSRTNPESIEDYRKRFSEQQAEINQRYSIGKERG